MEKNVKSPFTVLLLGDSITQYGDHAQGWAALLREHYEGRCQFVNLGISGLNSRQYLAFMRCAQFQEMLPRHADIVLIGLGANDAAYGLESPDLHQGVALDEFAQNLRDMVAIARNVAPAVYLVAPPPLQAYRGRSPQQTEQYAAALVSTAKQLNMPCIDIRSNIAPNTEIHADGLHLNAAGNRALFESVRQHIGERPFWRAHWSEWQD